MILRYAALCAVFLVAGCAGMSKEECVFADWGAIGYEDGAAGLPVSAISSRRSICARKAGVTVDMAAYLGGREEGLQLYCQPSRGFAEGSRGRAYHGVCTGPGEYDFAAAYQAGRQLFELQRAVAVIAAEIRQARIDLSNVEHQIADVQTFLVSPDTPALDRVELLVDLKTLSEEKGNIETALVALNRDHVRAEEDLFAYQEHLALNGPYPGGVTEPMRARY